MANFQHLHRPPTLPISHRKLLGPARQGTPLPRSTQEPSPSTTSDQHQRAKPMGYSFDRLSILPPLQKSTTGMPETLKRGIENLSSMSMDDVHVHYNSPKPAQVHALAYTQGTEIHVGPGHEQHLPHEAWHVVQQKQGRVQPTLQAKGVLINDDTALEQEASIMGTKAANTSKASLSTSASQENAEPEKGRLKGRNKNTPYVPSLHTRNGQVTIQRIIQWGHWTQHLWSHQNMAAALAFPNDQKLTNDAAKVQINAILQAAALQNPDIQTAINAPGGVSYDLSEIAVLQPPIPAGQILPNFKDPEYKAFLDQNVAANKEKAGKSYLLVEEGIHKSQGDQNPHITVRIFTDGVHTKTYHVRVKFTPPDKWELDNIHQTHG